ncbi:DUF3195 domain-containing protein [Pyrobaculum neutrophilum]|uniref:PAE0736-like N-terminal domain-containing protein n=1 Tax=Pyrobaculum neutrophilum (strain DSM 2338 / JCM 9278 / NBRC 100436 / V24Sta) TaxID=444157 RepID=B1YC70_PYRNV|nr:DUF3195 domain-containing protein [Pyrobaculum neutrophilum]ACB40924.1 conserved hypothetical protein [Pyrobaculum neutrophilum V24Sta]
MRRHFIVYTTSKKEAVVARDLCDCLYYYDSGVMCEALAPSRVYVHTEAEYLERCLGMRYFKALVKGVEAFDDVSRQRPSCAGCRVVEVGGRYFISWGL